MNLVTFMSFLSLLSFISFWSLISPLSSLLEIMFPLRGNSHTGRGNSSPFGEISLDNLINVL